MKNHAIKPLTVAIALVSMATGHSAIAQGSSPTLTEEVIVEGSLRSLPGEDVEVFGFGKSLLETPRSASTISIDQIERFNVVDIDELVAFAPGTFTQSFFGVAGSLDVRGTPGETYFRGVRRLDNPGNYPTPIGASDRIDIVRGPASPIYGPSKIGGYLNFNPKSARAEGGAYLDSIEGEVSYTGGSWDKNVVTAEVGGPLVNQELGYYLYAEVEDSGSYYDNTDTEQTVLQASFDWDLSDNLRLQFGGMYHDYEGNQVAGWNRLTQDLVDNGTYITGNPTPLDTDGNGEISHQEYDAVAHLINPFFFNTTDIDLATDGFQPLSLLRVTDADFAPEAGLVNPGTAQLDRSNVLVAPDDTLENEVTTLYFDVIYDNNAGMEIKNQMFYETYDNLNENAYGFSQFHDSWVFEDKIVVSFENEFSGLTAATQISPSIRYTSFEHGDDFNNEYFDRRDLTGPSTALDRRTLATRLGYDYTTYAKGDYMNLGFAAMTDLTFDMGLSILLGARYDTIDIDSESPGNLLQVRTRVFDPAPTTIPDDFADDEVDGLSWNISVSYETPIGLIPYFTASEQSTLVAGQGAEIGPDQVRSGAFDTSELIEFGVKGSFLDDTLYFAIASYEQKRTDFSAQAIVTNATTENKGLEAELRWVVTDQLVVTAGYTNIEVENLTAQDEGNQFSFLGAADLPNVIDPAVRYGGNPIGLLLVGSDAAALGITNNADAVKAGIPENIYTLTATYDFLNGFAGSVSVIDVEETYSGFSNAVELPAYTLVNAGLSYEYNNFNVTVTGKNLTDEEYFRSNFPDLFGSQIVLPELPRHYQATVSYKF